MAKVKKKDIERIYKRDHKALRDCYYAKLPFKDKGILSKEQFGQLHNNLWKEYNKGLLSIGEEAPLVSAVYDRAIQQVLEVMLALFEHKTINAVEMAKWLELIFQEGEAVWAEIGWSSPVDFHETVRQHLLAAWQGYYDGKVAFADWSSACGNTKSFVLKGTGLPIADGTG